nr:hypothetical protein GCM10025732_19570 [Glycomyces mayteni]
MRSVGGAANGTGTPVGAAARRRPRGRGLDGRGGRRERERVGGPQVGARLGVEGGVDAALKRHRRDGPGRFGDGRLGLERDRGGPGLGGDLRGRGRFGDGLDGGVRLDLDRPGVMGRGRLGLGGGLAVGDRFQRRLDVLDQLGLRRGVLHLLGDRDVLRRGDGLGGRSGVRDVLGGRCGGDGSRVGRRGPVGARGVAVAHRAASRRAASGSASRSESVR